MLLIKMIFHFVFLSAFSVAMAVVLPPVKVEPQLHSAFQSKSAVNIFIKFHDGNAKALEHATGLAFTSRAEQIQNLVSSLKSYANSSQRNAIEILSGNRYKQIWASNELYVEGATKDVVANLAGLPEVSEIREERIVILESVEQNGEVSPLAEWNLEKIEADRAWQLPGGNNGAGVVVANIDTGVHRTHEALRNNHRESYGWFDPYDGTEVASDDSGVGTHTMGIMVGAGGIGVAPGAQWIACRGCDMVSCTEVALKACGQWVLCPSLPNGEAEDCSKAPKVVSNSWGGGKGNPFYNDILNAWYAANIISVFGIGNGGPTCGTVGSPGDQRYAIGVGATTAEDTLALTSGTGPSLLGRIKPDLVAPGTLIRSAWNSNDGAYLTVSGTSMAAPHVGGVAALVLSQNPNLTYDQVVSTLQENADRDLPDTGLICMDIPSTVFPNNQYGYGRLNARKALEAAIDG